LGGTGGFGSNHFGARGAGSGGGLYQDSGSAHPANTLLALNTAPTAGPDAAGAFASRGHNLVGQTDGSSGWGATDKTGTSAAPLNPKLAALANNGGPTNTRALQSGSPAIDAGNDSLAPHIDQRDYSRAGVSDIGAFEFGGQ